MSATAWVLDLGEGLKAAVSEREMRHLVTSPVLHDVPVTPFHCRQAVAWNNEILPVVDLAAWLHGRVGTEAVSILGVFGYQKRPGAPLHHGAMILRAIPRRISVNDTQASDLPTEPKLWEKVALACFESAGGERVPIIDLGKVFSGDICYARTSSPG